MRVAGLRMCQSFQIRGETLSEVENTTEESQLQVLSLCGSSKFDIYSWDQRLTQFRKFV